MRELLVLNQRTIRTADGEIGHTCPCFVIAEAGVNHNGSLDLALQLVDTAADCGADAVKFQTFRAKQLVTADAPQAAYQVANTGRQESQLEMLQRLELSADDHQAIVARCRARGIAFMSTPFDEESVDFLDGLGMPFFKIPSGEATNLPLVHHIASKHRPVILSTGMCNLADVEAAIETLERAGVSEIVVLHCVSNYPADPADTNLRSMHTLATCFGYPVGYSDHTLGEVVSLAAVSLGACVIEKHFTLDRSLPGPDHKASSEPNELRRLIQGVRTVEAALGNGRKRPVAAEIQTASAARRSLVAARRIGPGETIDPRDLVGRRPGTGLPTSMLAYLAGRTTRVEIAEGQLVTLEMFA